jgi:hypothetical protein
MMIKVGSEYLDFDEQIEVEKQIKLVEEISTTDGDFSYSFELQKTLNNTRILGNPMPDNLNKGVYQRIEASILNSDGAEIYKGYLRIEKVLTGTYTCSFFAGNNNWFGMITGLMSELPLSEYDQELNIDNVQASWDNTSGSTYTMVDNGALFTRGAAHLKIEDFVPGIYVKTLFQKIFNSAGIKLQGELLNDWMFQNIICQKSPKNSNEIDRRTSYVQKTTLQIEPEVPATIVPIKVLFDNDTTYPFFDGDADLFDLPNSRYIADVPMDVEISASFLHNDLISDRSTWIYAYVNGVQNKEIGVTKSGPTPVASATTSGTARVSLNTGDILEIYIEEEFSSLATDPFEIYSGNVKITPIFLYKNFGASTVPNWTQQQFVSNVLRLFNALPSYNTANSTLTINLFDKIKERPALDLSEYISDTEVDYSEFVANYGKKSKMSYNEVEFDDLKAYNSDKYFDYGQGYIEVNNDFIEPETDIIESDFSNPIAYEGVFDMSLERLNLIELEEGDLTVEYTDVVQGNDGAARFGVVDDILVVGDLVRIEDEIDSQYNGDWIVSVIGSGWVELNGLAYNGDIAGEFTKLEYVYADNDDVFLLVNVPDYTISKFSGKSSFRLEEDTVTSMAMGYFDIINTGRQVNSDFLFSLSFGGIVDNRQYQIPLTDKYFRLLGRVLNDPVKLFSTAHLPNVVYRQIDFLSPITIRTLETTNQYYVNRITGYKESYLPCTLELIKLP